MRRVKDGKTERWKGASARCPILIVLALLSIVPSFRLSAAQCPDGSTPPCQSSAAYAAPPPNSVAVLYFDNLSADTADAYLADGLTEEIASRLGDIRRILVKQASREGVRRLREATPDYRVAVGHAMGVRHLVEGSLRRAGPRVRVVARLINTASGFRVWGQTYDRAAADLLALEEEIAREIATSIAGQLAPAERTALVDRPTTHPDAYEHFLRGNYYLAKRSVNGLHGAIDEYEAAALRDPRFTRAIARAGFVYGLSLTYGWALPGLPRDSMLARALALASRALAQDSSVSDAWLARGYATSFLQPRTLGGVIEALDRALALDPRNSEALQQYGFFLRVLGRDSAARAASQRSLEIEPDRPITLSALGVLSFFERRYEDSQRWLDSSLHVNPEFFLGYLRRARARLMLGDPAGARADAETALRLGGADSSLGNALLAMADVQTGDTVTARTRLSRVLASADTLREVGIEVDVLPAAALVTLGDGEVGLRFLQRMRPRGARLWYGLRGPEFDQIRSDPRFQRLVEESRPR